MVYEWQPPSFWEIFKVLGLRVLEVVIAAGAHAAGREIAYFFGDRRFFTQDQYERRDYR